jgi:hypothetical protein
MKLAHIKRRIKPVKAWMIYDGSMFLVWTSRFQKHTCIHDYVHDCGEDEYSWAKLRAQGCICVRVEIREIK